MRRSSLPLIAFLCLAPFGAVAAQAKTDFCRGFEEGWKAERGERAVMPICPVQPITSPVTTPYRVGLKAGFVAAKRSGGDNTGGAPSQRHAKTDFCDGFTDGWKATKGDLAVAPLCPIESTTPLGSTPYREGLKAGFAKAE